jgi:hypothetical protein
LDALPQIERDKYLVKNRHKLPKNEWEKYTKKQTRFTSSGGRKKDCLCHGWTAEGVTFYKEEWKFGGDSLQIEMCGRSWKLHGRPIYQVREYRSGERTTLIILAVWRRRR